MLIVGKIKFEQLEKSFSETKTSRSSSMEFMQWKKSIRKIHLLKIFSLKHQSLLPRSDKPEALKFYIYYLYYDLKSDRIDNKQLTKTIQKKSFQDQRATKDDFSKVVADLNENKRFTSST